MADPGARTRVGNALWLSAGEALSRLIAFVATVYVAVVLGPGGFGILGFAVAVVTYAMVAIEGGFVDVGSRAVARRPDEASTIAASATASRLLIATGLFAILILLSPLLRPDPEGRAVLIVTGLLLFASAADPSWVFKGLSRGGPVALSLVLRRLVFAVLVVILVADTGDLLRVPAAQFAGEVVGVLWLGRLFVRLRGGRIDVALGWRMIRSSGDLLLSKLFRTSIITFDVVLLGLLLTDRDVGLYSAPYRFCFLLMAIAGAVQVAYLPTIVQGSPGAERKDGVLRHLEMSAVVGLPLAAGGATVAGPLLVAVFGTEYADAAQAFALLLLSLGILFVFSPIHNLLLAQDRLRVQSWAMGIGAAVNIVLNLIWIPRYGIVGAATATLLAELIVFLVCWASVRSVAGVALLGPMIRPALASAAMAALLLTPALAGQSVWLSIPVGATAYGLTLVLLGGVPADARAALLPERDPERS